MRYHKMVRIEGGGAVVESPELMVEERAGFAVLTLNRPERRNALTASLLGLLAIELDRLAEEGGARCAVIRGTGEHAFSVGMDLNAMAASTPEENQRLIGPGGPLRLAIASIEEFPYPVIAMVRGYAAGAGCELATACDLRIGCGQVLMGMPPAKLGIVYPPEGIERFVATYGLATARKLFYTARYFETEELSAMGMLDFVCGEELEGFTMELARDIASLAPLSMKGHKSALRAIAREGATGADAPERAAMNEMASKALRSADASEGLKAFLDKRPPRFKGE